MFVLYSHVSWLTFLFFMVVLAFYSAITVLYMGESVSLVVSSVSINGFPLKVSFLFDFMSLSFMSVVLLISAVIMLYSYNYMAPYSKSGVFLWLTFLFILSMLIVVCMSSLLFLMLGWDGLGLVSFFLIVYYQNQSAITSGLFTLLMNRIGDCFFLVSLGFIFSSSFNVTFSYLPYTNSYILSALLMVAFMTKSALFPFSSWLPLAMAAPTPISALVHSSTLVTAGLYLMMRFSSFFTSFPTLMSLLTVLSIFTSFYAGLNAVFESDLKKLIALSTLSHLGFIGLAFFQGFIGLAFFHLLTHALFKSLLFMAMGDIMTNLNHSQDIRFLSCGSIQTPGSCFIMYVSLLNLLGLPSLSGFFSKDLVLESFHYSFSSVFLLIILMINVAFTYFYTYQLFFYSFQSMKGSAYSLIHAPLSALHVPLMSILGLSTLLFFKFFLSSVVSSVIFVPVPLSFKLLPLSLNALMFGFLLLKGSQLSINSSLMWFFFSSMGGLSLLSMPVSSFGYFKTSFSSVQSMETGFASYLLNSYPSFLVSHSSAFLARAVAGSNLSLVFYSLPWLVVLALFY